MSPEAAAGAESRAGPKRGPGRVRAGARCGPGRSAGWGETRAGAKRGRGEARACPDSIMARVGFKRRWTRYVPQPIEWSVYVLVANLFAILLLWHWRPLGPVVWDVRPPSLGAALFGLFATGWLLVPLAGQMIKHFDLFGTRQAWLHLRRSVYPMPSFRTPTSPPAGKMADTGTSCLRATEPGARPCRPISPPVRWAADSSLPPPSPRRGPPPCRPRRSSRMNRRTRRGPQPAP